MIEVFKSNRRAAILIASAIGVLLLASALSACQIEDLIKIDVPDGVATAIDVEPSISVSDSSAAWEDWQAYVERESRRFADAPNNLNGKMSPRQIRQHCILESDAENLLKSAMEEMGLSARAHDKILRLSRTIADLDASDSITTNHLSEAINYRTLDRSYWT